MGPSSFAPRSPCTTLNTRSSLPSLHHAAALLTPCSPRTTLALHHALLSHQTERPVQRRKQYRGERRTGREAYVGERRTRRRDPYSGERFTPSADFTPFRRLHAIPPTSRPSADFTPSRRLDAFSPSSRLFAEIVPPEFIPLAELIPRRVHAFRRERECASPEVGSEFGRSPPLFLWAASWLSGERRPVVPAGHASCGKVRALAHRAGPGGNFSRPQVPGKISREPSEAGSARHEPRGLRIGGLPHFPPVTRPGSGAFWWSFPRDKKRLGARGSAWSCVSATAAAARHRMSAMPSHG